MLRRNRPSSEFCPATSQIAEPASARDADRPWSPQSWPADSRDTDDLWPAYPLHPATTRHPADPNRLKEYRREEYRASKPKLAPGRFVAASSGSTIRAG